MRRILLPFALSLILPLGAFAQTGDAQSLQNQESALQAQITQGMDNGSLSAQQIEALQERLQSLQVGSAGTLQRTIGPTGIPEGEHMTPLGGGAFNGRNSAIARQTNDSPPAPTTTQTKTGPDPFTYNSLGPDAYQAQKYKDPAYAVPAYPTTNPQADGTQQQFSGPSAGSPYGAGYQQQPANQGVYVYRPQSTR